MKQFNAKAFSLVETAIVLGVVGLIVGGIWAAAADLNYRRNYETFMQGFISQKRIVNQFLNQTVPCTSPMSAGSNGMFVKYVYPDLYADLVPSEWKEIDTSKFCEYNCSVTHISCDANNTRYYVVAVMTYSAAKCAQYQQILTGRLPGALITTDCSGGGHYSVNVFYDIPRN